MVVDLIELVLHVRKRRIRLRYARVKAAAEQSGQTGLLKAFSGMPTARSSRSTR